MTSLKTLRGLIMYYAFLTIYAVLMAVFAPPLVNLYLQYAKEPTAPYLIQIHPYRIPFIGIGVILVLGAVVVVILGIRDHRQKKKKSREEVVSKSDLEALEKRLDSIERRIP